MGTINCIIATAAMIGLDKPGWNLYDRVDEGVRKTHLETDFVVMRMINLSENG